MGYLVLTIFLWGSTAVLAFFAGEVDPLFLMGASLIIAGLIGLPILKVRDIQPKPFLATSLAYFFYNICLFEAFKRAPIVEANLIQDSWPTFIILLGPLFVKKEKFNAPYFITLIVSSFALFLFAEKALGAMSSNYLFGYLLALCAAVIWSTYSLYAKSCDVISASTIIASSLFSGALAMLIFSVKSGSILPALTTKQMVFLFLMGIGPFGVSGYTWTIGIANVSSSTVGLISQLTPVISNILLFVFAGQSIDEDLFLPAILILACPIVVEKLFGGTSKSQ